ncbi:hypothetical protein [Paenibacillus piscarius]|uniref:hypothetical protein n=1 Tax=Paenibacillus piscarius TaxID=1089681 RepID=UPI001EE9A92E|nr:hypothetical protein [Paenibacillus piscarius]
MMRQALLAGVLFVVMILSACGNNSAEPASPEEVQDTVLNFYNEMTRFDEMGKTSLENFNATLTSYSTGQATGKELQKAVDQFQNTASKISDQVSEVKISKGLPDTVETLLRESFIAFKSAYDLKEQASKSAVSPDVTPEEFNAMNQQADVAMLYGISKLNEARLEVGLITSEDGLQTSVGTVSDADAKTDTESTGSTAD